MPRLDIDEINEICENVSLIDYFFYLEKQNKVKFYRKTGHDHYFLTEKNKYSVTDSKYFDFKTGNGGQIIKAVMEFENKSWKEAIDFLKNFSNLNYKQKEIHSNIDAKQKEPNSKLENITKIIPPTNEKLLQYFENRGISRNILKEYSKEIHYLNESNGKQYFGIGIENESSGYEIRNPFIKTKIGHGDISIIKGEKNNKMVVFEGMTDMFSFLQMCKDRNIHNDKTLVVLNSVSNTDNFIEKFKNFSGKIHLILDGDKAGCDAAQKIKDNLQNAIIQNEKQKYHLGENGIKDLNDYLNKLFKKNNIPEKNSTFAENKILNNKENGHRTKQQGLSNSKPVENRSVGKNTDRNQQASQSEQEPNNTIGQELVSNNAGNGFSSQQEFTVHQQGGLHRGHSEPVEKNDSVLQRGNTRASRTNERDGLRGNTSNVPKSGQNLSENVGNEHLRIIQSEETLSTGGNKQSTTPPNNEKNTGISDRPYRVPSLDNFTDKQKLTNEQITDIVNSICYIDKDKTVQIHDDALVTNKLKSLVSQYKSGGIAKEGRGILDEYYTNEKLAKAVGKIIKNNFKQECKIDVLEPSVGTGNFISALKNLSSDINTISAFEINETTAKITKILNPDVNVNLRPFETEFITESGQKKFFHQKYDLVIGNPPYGEHRGFYKGLGEEIKISKYEDYFVKRSIDVLKEEGTLAMVLPSGWLNRQKGLENAELQNAYRLPNGIFKGTDVGTDIIILKKNSNAEKKDISNYFKENPNKVLGEITKKNNRFGKTEDFVKGSLENVLDTIEKDTNNYKEEKNAKTKTSTDALQLSFNFEAPEKEIEEKEEKQIEKETLIEAKNKVEQALQSLDSIKIKSLSVVGKIKFYQELKKNLYNEKITFSDEELKNISKNSDAIIALSNKKDKEEYTLQVVPEIKNKILKYQFVKEDEIVDSSLQNNPSITPEQIKAFEKTNYKGEIDVYNNPELIKFANYTSSARGKYVHDFYYVEGDIYEKLEQLEKDRAENKDNLPDHQWDKQKALLEKVLPEKKELKDIIISPNHEFVHKFVLETKEIYVEKEYGYNYFRGRNNTEKEMVDYTIADKFKDFISSLPSEALRPSNSWEVREFVDNIPVTGSDKERNALVRERRKEVANSLFVKFLHEELSDCEKEKFVNMFNRHYNNIHIPNYSEMPLFSKIYKNFKGKPLELTEVQKAGIGRLTTKGVGLLAHEVGFGKTLSGVLAMHEAMDRGNAKRPLIVVPNDNILKQWVETIAEVIPDAKVNVLGNLGKSKDLSNFENKDGEITLVNYEGFKNIGFSKDITDNLVSKFGYISESETKGIINSERDVQKELQKQEETKGRMLRGKVYDWEDFGFDHLTFDEVHNANHIVGKVRIEDRRFASDFRSQNQTTSQLGINTWMASQYIQDRYDGRNVTLLSATPFTNKPLEYYSILSLLANERLEKSGYFNVNNFFETFMEADNEMEINAHGNIQNKSNVKRFKNNALFQQLLGEFIDIKGEEDNPELKRPNRINKEYKIEQNDLTKQAYERLNDSFDDNDKGAILKHILNARLIAISPYLYQNGIDIKDENYTAKEFVENSPKLKLTMDLIKQNKIDKPEANQIIYSELAVAEFPKLKEYLVKEVGYKNDEIEIITGAVNKNKRLDIQEAFNKGHIKVIIGSEAIQEGMNLQDKTSDMYLLSLPYNFTSLRQTEGRAWRQGNQWENVRINYMLTNDSIDVFMLQKLQAKQSRYMEAMKKGVDVVDVSDVNTEELKTAVITNPVTRADIEIELMKKRLESDRYKQEADLGFVSRKFKDYFEEEKKFKKVEENYFWVKKEAQNSEYWKGQLPGCEERYKNAQKKLELVADKMMKKGVDVVDFQNQAKKTQDEIERINKFIEQELPQIRNNLIKQYTKEKENKANNTCIDFVKEREQENKTFFNLNGYKKNAEKEEIINNEYKTVEQETIKPRMKR